MNYKICQIQCLWTGPQMWPFISKKQLRYHLKKRSSTLCSPLWGCEDMFVFSECYAVHTLINSVCRVSTVLCVSSAQWQCWTEEKHNYLYNSCCFNLKHVFIHWTHSAQQLTYTFLDFLSDADKSVGQSAGRALILWLSGDVVAEHSLDVETQDKPQETAHLTVLREAQRSDYSTQRITRRRTWAAQRCKDSPEHF